MSHVNAAVTPQERALLLEHKTGNDMADALARVGVQRHERCLDEEVKLLQARRLTSKVQEMMVDIVVARNKAFGTLGCGGADNDDVISVGSDQSVGAEPPCIDISDDDTDDEGCFLVSSDEESL